ncbi:MAG: calcium/sodium antiporter [Bacteroidales bacterium]|nr:calcium/sodium antiporter [Bacteroidales bacterium]
MSSWILIVLAITGLVLLKFGADWFVRGSSSLAYKTGISQLAIGITVVAFGTSSPEMVVNILASVKDSPDIVMGNIIGSNVFNLFLILSIIGIIAPIKVQSGTAWKEIPFSLLAIIILAILANDTLLFNSKPSVLSRIDGIILMIFFLMFLFYVFRQLGKEKNVLPENNPRDQISGLKTFLLIMMGLAGLIAGGKLVLDNAVELAVRMGMSQKIIGLTIIAAGTSLPELATSIMAAIRKNTDIAVGNIIGSNIFNILLILSTSAIINPLQFSTKFNFDIIVLSAGTLVLLLSMYTGKKKEIDRWEAIVLLLAYIAYVIFMLNS